MYRNQFRTNIVISFILWIYIVFLSLLLMWGANFLVASTVYVILDEENILLTEEVVDLIGVQETIKKEEKQYILHYEKDGEQVLKYVNEAHIEINLKEGSNVARIQQYKPPNAYIEYSIGKLLMMEKTIIEIDPKIMKKVKTIK